MKTSLSSKIEALLFVAGDDGLTIKQLSFLTESDEQELKRHLGLLEGKYDQNDSGIMLKQLAGVYQLVTRPEMADTVQKLADNPTAQALSQASLEVLSIIAYKQPITRVEIEDLRGVKSEKALHTLSAKALVQEVGRAERTGRAILYGTTKEFLDYFGLQSLKELPPLPQEAAYEEEQETDLFMTKLQETFKKEPVKV
ncbi:SMC-Scp complex subunit ScpB [Planomicrobium sp. YIM 101495]|uniref:SMC-Scp complex subunit ScpB n=1 Tax=Planomicrobium sp. YIM 101495 TaxID=2665160 RepID=UPI0012B767D2|nr:SMC-Scp complex subunit ScpB [Planomicrobium sp. YIM 101495]MTD30095.1 SMC-Scp complex subunit ScpB [Planomicrobium sp. YIM 101495]